MGVCKSYWKQHSSDGKTSTWRLTLPLSLSWDHRVIDGAAAARFNVTSPTCSPTCGAAVLSEASPWQLVEVKVPDIGDFKDVAVIEVMVKPGETIAVDTGLIMVESDKASMEIPSSHAGMVKELKVKLGDKVSEGSVILVVEAAGAAAAAPHLRRPLPQRHRPQAPAPHRCRARPGRRQLRRQGRHRMRDARARRRPRRLLRRVPHRRPRHEDRAGRALSDARRRVPERRLHPVEGAAAHRSGDGRGRSAGRPRHQVTASPRSTSTSCAASRTAWSRSSPAAWPAWPRRARSRWSPASAASSTRTTWKSLAADGSKKVVKFAKAIIAAGSPGGEAAVHARGRRASSTPPARCCCTASRSACW